MMRSRIAAVLRRLAQRLDPQIVVALDRPAYEIRAGLVVTDTIYSHGEASLALVFRDSRADFRMPARGRVGVL